MSKPDIKSKKNLMESQMRDFGNLLLREESSYLDRTAARHGALSLEFSQLEIACKDFLAQLSVEEAVSQGISADNLVSRIVSFLLQEASKEGIELSLSIFSSGMATKSQAELIVASAAPVAKACLQGLRAESIEKRKKKNLFSTASVNISLVVEESQFLFRISDDGPGFPQSKSTRFIREQISKRSGSCKFYSGPFYGGSIELRAPAQMQQVQEARLLLTDDGAFAMPSFCIQNNMVLLESDSIERLHGHYYFVVGQRRLPVFQMSTGGGLHPLESYEEGKLRVAEVLIADFSFALICNNISQHLNLRVLDAREWMQTNSWFKNIGSYCEGPVEHLVPFVDGAAITESVKPFWSMDQ